tara:strand:+ start:3760 stop:4662 length:903 start_codon:yes stop_codon:yes gene_type:complete
LRKKLLIGWFIIVAGLFAWASLRRQQNDQQLREAKSEQIKNDHTQVAQDASQNPFPVATLAPALQDDSSTTQVDLSDLKLSDDKLLEKFKDKEEELAKLLIADAKRLKQCLLKDLCGEKPDANSPYFDKNNTPSHGMLERDLTLLVRLQEDGELESDQVSNQLLEEMLDVENETIQRMALELRLAQGIDDRAYERLLKRTPSLLPQASASALSQLAGQSKQSQSRRDQLIKVAKELLNSSDQSKAIEMAKRVKYIDVSARELEDLAKNTCHLLPQNRKAVHHHLGVVAESVGSSLSFNCN